MTSQTTRAFLATIALFALLGCQGPPAQVSGIPAPSLPAVPEPAYWPTGGWNNSTPEQQGMDSAKLAAMFDAIEQQELSLHSVLIIRNGYVVAEAYFAPYGPDVKHQLMSVTKSVSGMLAGIAVAQGKVKSASQPALDFFPGRTVANLDANKRSMTLEHLLSLTAGFDCSDSAGSLDGMFRSSDWAQFALDLPMAGSPGKQFSYCSPAAHLISPILSQATGRSERELANEALFAPLGIPPAATEDWATDPQGLPQGFGGLMLTPRDMAKLGFLYLHGGRWAGQQVVPASWVAASLAPHTTADQGRGYGYLFWLYGDRGYYSAMGLGGQDIHIIPAKNLVVVFTAAMDIPTHDDKVIKLLDDYVVPAAASTEPLPENAAAQGQLEERIARAASPEAAPVTLPALARSISGKVYELTADPNGWRTLSFTFEDGAAEALLTIDGSINARVGLDDVYRVTVGGGTAEALRGHWEGENTFVIDEHQVGSFTRSRARVSFSDGGLVIEAKDLVSGASATTRGRPAP